MMYKIVIPFISELEIDRRLNVVKLKRRGRTNSSEQYVFIHDLYEPVHDSA